MAKKSSPLRIIPLGGLDGIGKNMTAFEYENDMVLVDAGLMFPDDEQPGIDLVLPDYSYVLENEEKLRGIIITHGHEDHTGALPYLLMDLGRKVPIYSSKLTLGIIEGKLAEHRLNAPKFREVQNGTHINLGTFSIDFFSMTHSIPAALGVYMRTPAGSVMHTGDFKLDQTPIDGVTPNYQAIGRFSSLGVDLLLSDSTNATRPGFTPSESAVGPALRATFCRLDPLLLRGRLLSQAVDGGQEGRERLARAGGGDDQGVLTSADRGPGPLLHRGGAGGEGVEEPGACGRGESFPARLMRSRGGSRVPCSLGHCHHLLPSGLTDHPSTRV